MVYQLKIKIKDSDSKIIKNKGLYKDERKDKDRCFNKVRIIISVSKIYRKKVAS